MATPTRNTTYQLSERTKLWWGKELVAAGTVAALLNAEEFGTVTWSPQRTIWKNNLKTGFPSTVQGSQATVQHAQVTISVPAHAGGLAGQAMAALMGDVGNSGASDTITGTGDPYTHIVVPGVKSTAMNTFSLVFGSLMDTATTPRCSSSTARSSM